MKRDMFSKKATETKGVTPAIVLINPKFPNNVGMVLRLASSFGVPQVWFTGNRVRVDLEGKDRLPREERMRGYGDVTLINHDKPFDRFDGVEVVGVEIVKGAEPLYTSDHDRNAVYVFGPEDGSIDQATRRHCHRFVVIPSRHCLNLATAVATVLYDRAAKRHAAGLLGLETPGDFEGRGFHIGLDDGLGWQDQHDDVNHRPTGTVR